MNSITRRIGNYLRAVLYTTASFPLSIAFFVLVSIGVWIMRVKAPQIERPFKTPIVPVVSILGALICFAMIIALDSTTLKVAFGWMALGLLVYFGYSKKHSKLNGPSAEFPKASDFQ